MPRFPHLDDPAFPELENVNVYKYRNEFDYSRYDNTQMHITLCSVPWDMGEAHIGNRTISGIGNVVWFESEAKRDAWFAAIPDNKCIRLDTKYKELHRDNQIMLPVPFDVACEYNYIMVEYEPFANADSLIQYETLQGLDKWFWFIREVEFVSPNTTRVHLMNDAFQTFMYRIHLGGMVLERGHAPLFAIDADTFLNNPVNNTDMLYCEDVNYGDIPRVSASNAVHVFNSDVYACIACSSNPGSIDWGSKSSGDWRTPAEHMYNVNGAPDFMVFALDPSDLHTFLTNIDNNFPQFKQTVKGVFFAPQELVTIIDTFTFAGVSCHNIRTTQTNIDLLELDKALFRYPLRYADLAKLYMYPYAVIEVTDENGNVIEVRVEDTTGAIDVKSTLSLAFPVINIQGVLTGVGRSTSRTVTFANVGEKSFSFSGNWYKTLLDWDVPVFGIIQDNDRYNDFNTHFDRMQRKVEYDNSYDNAIDSNHTAYDNGVILADLAYDTSYNNAECMEDVAELSYEAGTGSYDVYKALDNANIDEMARIDKSVNNANTTQSNNLTSGTTNNQIDYTLQSASISAASGAINAATGAIANAAANPTPAGAAGAIAGVIGGVVNAGATLVQANASVNLSAAQAQENIDANNARKITANTAIDDKATQSKSVNITKNTTNKKVLEDGTKFNTDNIKLNADLAKAAQYGQGGGVLDNNKLTQDTNAGRDKDTAQNAVSNSVKQAKLEAPQEFGIWSNVGNATSKPLMVCANVVTQALGAIARAGDEFLRYGYFYNRQWDFDGNWNIGRYFTYWKLSDFWVKGLNVPDMYVDKLRFFLYGGVTVWRRPEDIGNVSIYDNMQEV